MHGIALRDTESWGERFTASSELLDSEYVRNIHIIFSFSNCCIRRIISVVLPANMGPMMRSMRPTHDITDPFNSGGVFTFSYGVIVQYIVR